MTWDHERVEELLAGHVLGGLDPEDADLAQQALLEHVPGCDRCRRAYDDFQAVAGDLALLAPASEPPDTLGARVARVAAPSRRRTPVLVGAAAALIIASLTASNLLFVRRLSDSENRGERMLSIVSNLAAPGTSVVPLTGPGDHRVAMIYVKGLKRIVVFATYLPDPDGEYKVWLFGSGGTWSPGTLRVRDDVSTLEIPTDPTLWQFMTITDEPHGDVPTPTESPVVSASVSSDE